jgi:hypothetical protein
VQKLLALFFSHALKHFAGEVLHGLAFGAARAHHCIFSGSRFLSLRKQIKNPALGGAKYSVMEAVVI